MSDRSLADLHPSLQPLAQQFLAACAEDLVLMTAGAKVGFSETYRSVTEQDNDYARGRTEAGSIITNAMGGESPHNCTLDDGTPAAKAFDFYIELPGGKADWNPQDALWQRVIAIGESLGLVSGSTWHSLKDWPHMEMKNWQTSTIGQVQEANQD